MADSNTFEAADSIPPRSRKRSRPMAESIESIWPHLRPRLVAYTELSGCLADGVQALVLVPGSQGFLVATTLPGWPATIGAPIGELSQVFDSPPDSGQRVQGRGFPTASQLPVQWLAMRRWAAEPLLVAGEVVGALCIADEEQMPWSAKLLDGLERMARLCADTLADQEALAQVARRRREDEQRVPGFFFELTESPQGRLRLPYLSVHGQAIMRESLSALADDAGALFGRIAIDHQVAIRQNLERAVQTCQPIKGVFRLDLSADHVLWLRGEVSVRRQPDGTVVATGYLDDVSELMSLTRRADLAQADSRAKAGFTAQLSHEVRAPLAGILGFAQQMRLDRQHPLRGEQNARLNQIELASHRLLELAGGVLDLARLEDGKDHLDIGPVDARTLLTATLAMLQPLADAYGMEPRLEGPDRPCAVLADERALNQVMTNLLSNAIKYNRRQGRITVTLALDQDQYRLSVADEGPGITAEQMPLLFTPFRRFSPAAQAVEGSGLGLAISRRLVEAMGGQISVRSTPGQGSCFEVLLPAAGQGREPAGQRGSFSQAVADRLPSFNQGGGGPVLAQPATILCVEDDRLSGMLIESVFAQCPAWTLHLARSVREAREYLASHRPDLLITDVNLPDGRGHELLALVAGSVNQPAVPCIAVSADGSAAQVRELLAAGFADFWPKPIDLQGLPALTAHWLKASAR